MGRDPESKVWRGVGRLMCVLLVGVGFNLAAPASEAQLAVSGYGPDLWLAHSTAEGDACSILHRRARDEPDRLDPVTSFHGAAAAIAAGDRRLWIIHETRAVYLIRVLEEQVSGVPRYSEPEVERKLPEGTSLRCAGADHRGLWVMVAASNAQVLESLDRLTLELDVRDPSDRPERTADESASPTPAAGTGKHVNDSPVAAADASVRAAPAADRLLRLHRNRWVREDLPAAWPGGGACWILGDASSLRLATLVPLEAGSELATFRTTGDGWEEDRYRIASGESWLPVLVESQIIVGWRSGGPDSLEVMLVLLRGQKQTDLGALPMAAQDGPWQLAPVPGHVAMLEAVAGGQLPAMSLLNLQGSVTQQRTPLKLHRPSLWVEASDLVLWVATLALATVVMLVFWKRDPQAIKLELPDTMALGDLGRRLAASLVDIVPCVLVSMAGFRISDPGIFYEQWPGHAGSWDRMLPGGLAIGLYVGHCLFSELLGGRTLGKWLFSLRVTDLNGKRPRAWQILLRNLMKALDLIAPPLLVLMLAGPYRQRLGDLVGRTVVVVVTEPKTAENRESGEDDDFD